MDRALRLLASLGTRAVTTERFLPAAAIGACVLVLASVTISRILENTGGVPAAPLDDSYIHFQFARAYARGEPLVYAPGTPPVAGATSLLWPLVLSIPYALGLREHAIVWASWVFGFAALGLLAWEARRAAERFCSPLTATGAAALVLAFGANTWFAASGMEVVPLAWLLLRAARRAADWWEAGPIDAPRRAAFARELCAIALALPLLRPEGTVGSVCIAAVLGLRPHGATRLWALAAAACLGVPSLVNRLIAGEFSSTTARAKWLVLSPYSTVESLLGALRDYVALLLGTLLDGEIWSALFLPRGSAPFAVAALVALLVAGVRRGALARALLLFTLALGILIPATYDCPLCNRLRYLWPFFPAWMVGAAALAELVGELAARRTPELRAVGPMLVGGFAGALGGFLPFAIDDVAQSARAIHAQQVSLGLWARDALPERARIGVNDAGAITYFSGRTTFDVVGLTTAGEARYWTAGPGSRFEHYERLGPSRLPTHFIVYPEWFAIDALLGEELTARYVPGATILGGERMSAHVADYSRLRSAEAPDPSVARGRAVVDRLDVADLESEAEHDYQLFDADRRDNVVIELGERVDGARAERALDSFWLVTRPGGAIVLRVAAPRDTTLELQVGAVRLTVGVPASRWHEARVELPADAPSGRSRVTVRSAEARFSALHYFSLAP